MREILFRGKRVDNGKWVEGHYGEYYSGKENVSCISIPKETISGSLCYDVIPETVGQYTGMKDLHGTRIFEGDVCKAYICKAADTVEKEVVGVICFEDGTFEFKCEHDNVYIYPLLEVLEVIRNVFDSPELLEGKK